MKLQGTRQVQETIEVSSYEIAEKIYKELLAHLRPQEVFGYDDWFVSKNGDLVGVNEYHHGSDSHTTVLTGCTALYNKIQSIKTVCTLLKEMV